MVHQVLVLIKVEDQGLNQEFKYEIYQKGIRLFILMV
jgi:uncharacterized protein (DUF952 family)